MGRLIDADALKKKAIRVSTVKDRCYMKAVGTHEIDKAPTVDAVPVVHGVWIKDEIESENLIEEIYLCSACENFEAWGEVEKSYFRYCPNCGAKMDGKEE